MQPLKKQSQPLTLYGGGPILDFVHVDRLMTRGCGQHVDGPVADTTKAPDEALFRLPEVIASTANATPQGREVSRDTTV